MVNADPNRDYYADLELQSSADINEIKKQFKRLALKYHPDRNPGHESEVNSKFQTIQSAHEVLTDPEQRAKYDAGRIRSTTFRNYGSSFPTSTTSTRGNPYASAGSQWQPPPKPPPYRKAPPPSSGAQKYKNFETPRASASKAAQEGPEARKNQFHAWENMRASTSNSTGPAGPGRTWRTPQAPPKEFTPQSGREESNSFRYTAPPKAKPGFEEFRATQTPWASFQRSQSSAGPRRTGFMPSTPGGDEPAAANTSAYFTHRNSRPSMPNPQAPPEPPPRSPPPAMNTVDPLRQFKEKASIPFEPRLSTPYATHGGEKTNPFESANINRSRSTRKRSGKFDPANLGPFSSGGSSDRHRSASPPRSQRHQHHSSADFIPRTDSDPNLASPKRTYTSVNSPSRTSKAEARYTPTGARKVPTVEIESSSSEDNTIPNLRRQVNEARQAEAEAARIRAREFAKQRNGATPISRKEQSIPDARTGRGADEIRKHGLAEFRKWWAFEHARDPELNDLPSDGHPGAQGNANRESEGDPTIFNFKVDGESFASTRPPFKSFTSNSAENISTTFASEDWQGKFTGDSFKNEQKAANLPPRARSSSRVRGRSPIKGRQPSRPHISTQTPFPDIDPRIPNPTTEKETPIESPGGTKFSAEDWSQTFKPQTFAPQPHPSPGPRPLYIPRAGGRKSRAPTIRPTMGTAAVVDDDDSSDGKPPFKGRRPSQATASSSSTNKSGPPTGAPSPNAMDIDSPMEEPVPFTSAESQRQNGFAVFAKAAGEARNVPVEPSRPEWRAGDSNGVKPSQSVPTQPDLPPRTAQAIPLKRRTTKSTDSEDFKVNLEDLKNAEPFKHPATGLNSFSDLTSNLPFPSKASPVLPIAISPKSGQLELPNPPKAPTVPQAPNKYVRPTQASWQAYLSAFKTYMVDWDLFNSRMIVHFVARKHQVDEMRVGWLEAKSDEGVDAYQEGCKEDRAVREWWCVAAEKHELNMKDFAAMRERMKGKEEREMAKPIPRNKAH